MKYLLILCMVFPALMCSQAFIPPDPLVGLSHKTGAPEIFTLEDRSTSGVTATLVIRTGSLYEMPTENGFGLMLKHAFWRLAASHYDESALQERLDSISARVSAFSGSGYTAFEIRTDSIHLREAIKILSECSHDLAVENVDLEYLRSKCIEDMKTRDSDPEYLIREACLEQCFGTDGYRIHGRPSPMVLFGSRPSQFLDYLQTHLGGQSISIWVSGNLVAGNVRSMVEALPWGSGSVPGSRAPVMHIEAPDSLAYAFYLDEYPGISVKMCFPFLFPDSLAQIPVVAEWCCEMMNDPAWEGFSELEERYRVSFRKCEFISSRGCGILALQFQAGQADSLPGFTNALLNLTSSPGKWLLNPEVAEQTRNALIWNYLDRSDATWSFTRDLWKQWAAGDFRLLRLYAHYLQFLGNQAILDFFIQARTSARPFVVFAANSYVRLPEVSLEPLNMPSQFPAPVPIISGNNRIPLQDIQFISGYTPAFPLKMKQSIQAIADWMKQHPETNIEVSGHSDLTGTVTARSMVAMGRATLIRDLLVKAGIDPARILIRNASDTEPVYLGTDPIGQKQNRRVSLVWK